MSSQLSWILWKKRMKPPYHCKPFHQTCRSHSFLYLQVWFLLAKTPREWSEILAHFVAIDLQCAASTSRRTAAFFSFIMARGSTANRRWNAEIEHDSPEMWVMLFYLKMKKSVVKDSTMSFIMRWNNRNDSPLKSTPMFIGDISNHPFMFFAQVFFFRFQNLPNWLLDFGSVLLKEDWNRNLLYSGAVKYIKAHQWILSISSSWNLQFFHAPRLRNFQLWAQAC